MISEEQSNNWKLTTLEGCGKWLSGGTPSKDRPDFWNGTVPWISAKSMNEIRLSDSEERITLLGAENGTRFAPKGSILILVRGSMLHQRIPIGIATRDLTFNQDVKAIIPASNVLPEFLLYWLLSNESRLLDMVEFTGIGAGKLSTDLLYSMEVKLPPLPEQHAISRILGSLDDKIELNNRMNETLEAMARAIFKSWFVDFDPVRAKAEGREPAGMDAETAALFPDSFEETELGMVPRGWEVKKLSDLCTTQYGYTASATEEPAGPKFLRVTDINKHNWIEWKPVPYCMIDAQDKPKYALRIGDIVVARMADPGKSAIIEEKLDAVFASYLVRLTTESLAYAYYIYGFLKSDAYREYSEGTTSGSVQANMNAKVIVAVDLPRPPVFIMEAYLERVLPLRKRIIANLKESRTLANVRDALLSRLLSREIQVKDTEQFLKKRGL